MALETAVDVVRFFHVHSDGIVLGHREIVVIVAGFSSVVRNVHTAIASHENPVGILRIDPQSADISEGAGERSSRRPADVMPCPATVIGAGYGDGGDIDILVVVRINPDLVEGISGFSTHIVLDSIHLLPCPACVIGPVNFTADLSFLRLQAAPAVLFLFFLGRFTHVAVFHHCVNDIRILPVDIQADASNFPFGKALLELFPSPAAVCRLVDPASRSASLEVPRVALFIVGCGIQHLRIIRVQGEVDDTHFFTDVKNFFPGFSSVCGLEHSTLFIVGK